MNSETAFFNLTEVVPWTGCWIWTGGLGKNGYGRYTISGKRELAHRIAFRIANGIDPMERLVCHHCDVPLCVNPSHLFLGTQKDNLQDMRNKGRGVNPPKLIGEMHYERKLNDDAVRKIRIRRYNGEKLSDIARDFNVSYGMISHIANGRKWKHII